MTKLPDETVNAAQSLFDLLYALTTQVPDLEPALRQGARVTFDAHEAMLIIGARQPDGTSKPLVALPFDPKHPEFATVCCPCAMPKGGKVH
jgi:hypothetical protein